MAVPESRLIKRSVPMREKKLGYILPKGNSPRFLKRVSAVTEYLKKKNASDANNSTPENIVIVLGIVDTLMGAMRDNKVHEERLRRNKHSREVKVAAEKAKSGRSKKEQSWRASIKRKVLL